MIAEQDTSIPRDLLVEWNMLRGRTNMTQLGVSLAAGAGFPHAWLVSNIRDTRNHAPGWRALPRDLTALPPPADTNALTYTFPSFYHASASPCLTHLCSVNSGCERTPLHTRTSRGGGGGAYQPCLAPSMFCRVAASPHNSHRASRTFSTTGRTALHSCPSHHPTCYLPSSGRWTLPGFTW